MRHLIIGTLLLLSSLPAMAQGGFVIGKLEKMNDEERALLRKGFKMPEAASIIVVKDKTFSTGVPLKICLETILDPQVREDLNSWITEWNKKEADKYGTLEIVSDSLQSDISVLRYLHPLPPSDPISAMFWDDPKGKRHSLIPVYSYLMVRKADSLEILWRKVDLTYKEEHEFSAKLLADQLKKLMKDRAKPIKK